MKHKKAKKKLRQLKQVKSVPIQRRLHEEPALDKTVLRFTPYAWAKLQWFCHHGAPGSQTEIGGFGIAAANNLLLIEDFVTVKQQVSCVSVEFDDEAVADFFEQQVDLGRKPQQFARIWLHTHPANSAQPSATDEDTFSRAFGKCDWAIMFILAMGGQTYARLRFNVGPKGEVIIPVVVDYTVPFEASNHEAWLKEYIANIHPTSLPFAEPSFGTLIDGEPNELVDDETQWLSQEQEFEAQLLAAADVDMDFDDYMDVDLYNQNEVI